MQSRVSRTRPEPLTCLEFWFSILVLTSGWRVKSGAKYSKYSTRESLELKNRDEESLLLVFLKHCSAEIETAYPTPL